VIMLQMHSPYFKKSESEYVEVDSCLYVNGNLHLVEASSLVRVRMLLLFNSFHSHFLIISVALYLNLLKRWS
jgi:hypothetical protein